MGLFSRSKAKEHKNEAVPEGFMQTLPIVISINYITEVFEKKPAEKGSEEIMAFGYFDINRQKSSNAKRGIGLAARGFPVCVMLTDKPLVFDEKGDPQFDWFHIGQDAIALEDGHCLATHLMEISIEPKEYAALLKACKKKSITKLEFEGFIKLNNAQSIDPEGDVTKIVRECQEGAGVTRGRIMNVVRVPATTL